MSKGVCVCVSRLSVAGNVVSSRAFVRSATCASVRNESRCSRRVPVCVVQCGAVWCSVVQCVAVCFSVVQCVAVRCSVLQCGAVWCSVLQCLKSVAGGQRGVFEDSVMSTTCVCVRNG